METLQVGSLYKTKDERKVFIANEIGGCFYGVVEGITNFIAYDKNGIPLDDDWYEEYCVYIDKESKYDV